MKVIIYIGRFEPYHFGHKFCSDTLIEESDMLITLIGSSNKRKSIKNPFSIETITNWIKQSVRETDIIETINDYLYNDVKWMTQIQDIVTQYTEPDDEIYIAGHHKDETSYYLDIFPNWKFIEVPMFENISGVDIREYFFTEHFDIIEELVPSYVYNDIIDFVYKNKNEKIYNYNYLNLKEEFDYYQEESKKFSKYPFPYTLKFMCSDAVVICNGYVLLVKRKFNPGKDCWALPGGFLNQDESFETCALRELYEETNLRIPEKILESTIVKTKMFDNPKRSLGIPRVSMAHYFKVKPDNNGNLPRANGGSDGAESKWFSISEIKKMKLYDDHSDIIDYYIGAL